MCTVRRTDAPFYRNQSVYDDFQGISEIYGTTLQSEKYAEV